MLGQKIKHYVITAKLGQGGMGEVYRARDTRLNREVAIKVLPEIFSGDEQRMGRFSREAQVLASLNHPNIAAIYGLESQDSGLEIRDAGPGTEAAVRYCLVMELVEGEDLSERIARGPIPLDEALPMALQIAEALENAHEKGIIHRDLKPANIKLTPDGKVKILDFGLAKALEDPLSSPKSPASGLSQSPTLSMAATQAGIILGTAAYMPPEQARGKPVDRRADIWAFGVVLFEMLTGKQAFSGEDLSLTLANVMKDDPDWGSLPVSLPRVVSLLLERCLTKDPKSRLRDIGEARITIEKYLSDPSGETAENGSSTSATSSPQRQTLPWALAGLLLLGLLTTLWILWPQPQPPEPLRRVVIEPGAGVELSFHSYGGGAVLSPDESMMVFRGRSEGGLGQLFLRRLDQLEAIPLPGTEEPLQAVFSPDGQWIAFRAARDLKKIAVTGGSAVTLCPIGASRGLSWEEEGSIVLASVQNEGLSRVSAVGGTPQPLTALTEGEVTHRWPQGLPGGQAVLFTAHSTDGQFDEARIVVQRLPDGERKVVWEGGYYGRYLPTGHLVYIHRGTLFAARFDLDSLEIQGQPAPILERVRSSAGTGFSGFSFSDRGSLLYVEGDVDSDRYRLEWLDRQGTRQELPLQPAGIRHFRISPSGKLLALQIQDGQQSDIWVYDIERDTLTRLTFDPGDDRNPVWSPSGRYIVFTSNRNGVDNLYLKSADGSGEAQRLTESENPQFPETWHPGGRYIGLFESPPDNSFDIRILEMEGSDESGWKAKEVVTFLSSPFLESRPQFSPDGNWLAYFSNESDRNEVYVRPFPGPGGKWQVSSQGGAYPRWSVRSQELYFEWNDRVYVSKYRVQGNSFLADRPVELANSSTVTIFSTRSYDVHPDGRILVRRRPGEATGGDDADHLILFENFFDYLKQQVPVP